MNGAIPPSGKGEGNLSRGSGYAFLLYSIARVDHCGLVFSFGGYLVLCIDMV